MKSLKKLVAVLFAALLLGGPVLPLAVKAQNFKNSETFYGVGGAPQLNFNSLGNDWGQECSPSSNQWQLGYSVSGSGGVPPTTCSTAALSWNYTPAVVVNAPLVYAQTNFGSAQNASFGVFASSTIPVSVGGSSYINLISSANATVLMNSTPTISTVNAQGLPIAGGTILVFTTTATAEIGLVDNGTLSGSLIKLGAGDVTIASVTSSFSPTFIFNSVDGFWHELSK